MHRLLPLALTSVALLAGGCGADDDPTPTREADTTAAAGASGTTAASGPTSATGTTTAAGRLPGAASPSVALARRLPGEAYLVQAMDLDAARQQLGIARDADVADYRKRESVLAPEARFDDAALKLFGSVTGVGKTKADAAVDHGQIVAAAAATLSPGHVLVFTTRQTPDALVGRLRAAGYVGEPRALSLAHASDIEPFPAAAVADGLVVLASSPDVAAGVLARTTPDPRLAPLLGLLARTDGALRVAQTIDDFRGRQAPCVQAVAGAERFGAQREVEDLLVRVRGDVGPGDVILDQGAQRKDILTARYRVKSAERDGDVLVLGVGTAGQVLDDDNAATIANGTVGPEHVVRCPGQKAPTATKPLFAAPPTPDRTGTKLEDAISAYLVAGGTAPEATKVRCHGAVPVQNTTIRCTGTRRHASRTLHYTIKVHFNTKRISSLDVTSPDDHTHTVF